MRRQLLFACIFVLTLMLVLSTLAYRTTEENRAANRAVVHSLTIIRNADEATTALVEMQTGYRGFLLTGDERYLEPYDVGHEAFPRILSRLRALSTGDPAQLARWDELERRAARWQQQITDYGIALRRDVAAGRATMDDVIAFASNFSNIVQFDEMLALITRAIATEQERLDDRTAHADDANRQLQAILVFGTGAVVVIGLLFALSLAQGFSSAAEEVAAAANDIAGGNYDRRIGLSRRDEIGRAAAAFDRMADQLQTAMRALDGALAEARSREAHIQAVMSGVGEAILTYDDAGTVLSANPAAERIFGLPAHQMLGRPIATLLPAHGSAAGAQGETRFRLPDGEERVAELTSSEVRVDDTHRRVVVARDVTERSQSERERERLFAAVERSRGAARAILDAANDAMVLVSPRREVRSINQRFTDMLGVDQEEVLYRQLEQLGPIVTRVFGQSTRLNRTILVSAADAETVFTQSVQQRWPEPRELELFSTPVHTRTGEHLGRLYVFRDVTNEREVDRMKSEFVSLVSHELRTPLTSIKGYVDLILDGDAGEISAPQRRYLGVVSTNVSRLVALINDLLDISRIEAGKIELQRSPVDLATIVQGVRSTLWPQLQAHGQSLTLDLATDLPLVWGDPDRLTQIVMNLASNAHKYTPDGGAIAISAARAGAMVQLEVRDTGIGLSDDEQAHLFVKFYRARNRTTEKIGGSGLGLSIVRSLVDAHGGAISVRSAPGAGSTFTVTLPAHHGDGTTAITPMSPERTGGRILVVEDEPDITELVRVYLERAGYEVACAGSAAEAVEMAGQEQPDLITLDVLLPDGDGFAVLEQLRDDPATAAIPVLLLSMLPDDGHGARLGAVDYLTKPVEKEVLLEHVRRVLAHDRSSLVLVVDDEPDVLALLTEQIRHAGHRVITASDGAEALELARVRRPELIVMDVRMPGMDGVAALRELRRDATTCEVAVIMLTASPLLLEDRSAEVAALGAQLFGKWVSLDGLGQTIGRQLGRERDDR